MRSYACLNFVECEGLQRDHVDAVDSAEAGEELIGQAQICDDQGVGERLAHTSEPEKPAHAQVLRPVCRLDGQGVFYRETELVCHLFGNQDGVGTEHAFEAGGPEIAPQ
jgi:hypothetical protein